MRQCPRLPRRRARPSPGQCKRRGRVFRAHKLSWCEAAARRARVARSAHSDNRYTDTLTQRGDGTRGPKVVCGGPDDQSYVGTLPFGNM